MIFHLLNFCINYNTLELTCSKFRMLRGESFIKISAQKKEWTFVNEGLYTLKGVGLVRDNSGHHPAPVRVNVVNHVAT